MRLTLVLFLVTFMVSIISIEADIEHYNYIGDNYHTPQRQKIVKKSPGCLLWCLRKKVLHPAQCHSLC